MTAPVRGTARRRDPSRRPGAASLPARGGQAERAYAAEGDVDTGRSFASSAEVQGYLDGLTASAWWAQRFPGIVRIEAVPIRSRSVAAVGCPQPDRRAGVVGVTPEGRQELTVLHEVAHAVCDVHEGHGATWARTYLELAFRQMGPQTWESLRHAFSDRLVDFG